MEKEKSVSRKSNNSFKEFFAGENSIFRRFGRKIKSAVLAVVHGSVAAKLSAFLFMGIGQMMRKQIIKGILYALVEVAFILFMVFFGGKYIGYLFSGDLGTRLGGEIWNETLGIYEYTFGDNSFLILLYGVVSMIVLAMFLVMWGLNVRGNLENDKRLKEGKPLATFRQDFAEFFNRKFYVPLLVPPLVGLLVFTVMPLVFMILIAFTNYDFEHTPPGRLFDWVGFANFAKLFSIGGGNGFFLVFLRVLAWTFIWAFFATFTNYFFGMILALMINKKGIKLKALWRTMFVIAIAVPQFVTLLLMQKILDSDGILNVILGRTGSNAILWLGSTAHGALLPRVTIILVNMWIGIPYTILMCSGILMNIPAEMYEAARLDGANPWQLFRHIVLPYMLHVTGPYLITQFVGNINNFNVIWLLTGGGPIDNIHYGAGSKAQATDLLVTWLYRLTTDVNPQYNIASVIGIIIFIICAALSLITYNRSKSTKNEEDYQ